MADQSDLAKRFTQPTLNEQTAEKIEAVQAGKGNNYQTANDPPPNSVQDLSPLAKQQAAEAMAKVQANVQEAEKGKER